MENVNKQLLDALKSYISAGFGNSTDFEKQGRAYDFAIEAITAAEQAQQAEPVAEDSAVAAIQFALETHSDGMHFLRLWNEGEFDLLRQEWPEAPQEIYIGADPLLEVSAQPPAVADMLAKLEEAEHHRDCLARAIRNAAVKAGIILADAVVEGPHLLMLADNLAEAAMSPAVSAPDGYALVRQEDLRKLKASISGECYMGQAWEAEIVSAMLAAAPQAAPLSAALSDIATERRRQMEVEGWTPERDDAYWEGHLADAAGCYALFAHDKGASKRSIPAWWPFRNEWWKPTTARRDLVKAGALIAAEIERIDRAAQKGDQ